MAIILFFVIILSMFKIILKQKWMWIIYLLFFCFSTGERLYAFFNTSHPAYLYHQTLVILSVHQGLWPITYILTLASLLLNTTTAILLYFYIINRKIFSFSFILFATFFRLISDIFGYSYEWNSIRALFYESSSAAILAALALVLWIIPSYLAMADYLCQKQKSQLKSNKAIK